MEVFYALYINFLHSFTQNKVVDTTLLSQTVLVYDLKAKRYERKLSGCYIAPAPSHEYVLLDGERLMGPSDTRTHLIIWNLVSGHAMQRIKTNFKEMERRSVPQGRS